MFKLTLGNVLEADDNHGEQDEASLALFLNLWPHRVATSMQMLRKCSKNHKTKCIHRQGSPCIYPEHLPPCAFAPLFSSYPDSLPSCPMDTGAQQATVHGVAKSWTGLKHLSTYALVLFLPIVDLEPLLSFPCHQCLLTLRLLSSLSIYLLQIFGTTLLPCLLPTKDT